MKRVFRNLSYLNNFAKMLRDARFRQHRLNSKKIYICSNPEFLREGKSWIDFNQADKIVIGSDDSKIIKISVSDAEKIKKSFSQSYTEFSYKKNYT